MTTAPNEHPYDLYLASRQAAPHWTWRYPTMPSEEDRLLRRAITMALKASDYPVMTPYEAPGLRLDGWLPTSNGYEFAFRLDKDLPYVVSFTRVADDLFEWKMEHWEV